MQSNSQDSRGGTWIKAYLKDLMRVKGLVSRSGVNVPIADLSVMSSAEQMTLLELTPRQAIPFIAVTPEPQIRIASTIKRWLRRVLAVIEHMHLPTNCLGGNHERVLRHVASSVHLPFVIYLLDNFHLRKVVKFS